MEVRNSFGISRSNMSRLEEQIGKFKRVADVILAYFDKVIAKILFVFYASAYLFFGFDGNKAIISFSVIYALAKIANRISTLDSKSKQKAPDETTSTDETAG